MDRAEEILKEQLKIDKAVGFGKLMWELHKNTIKKCMQIYVEEQLLLHNVSQQRELLFDYEKMRTSHVIGATDEWRYSNVDLFMSKL
jgi:hypothetical protein